MIKFDEGYKNQVRRKHKENCLEVMHVRALIDDLNIKKKELVKQWKSDLYNKKLSNEQYLMVHNNQPPCPSCGGTMKILNFSGGRFWGCKRKKDPFCRGSLSIKK